MKLTPALKQFLGAAGGMAVATVAYVVMQNASFSGAAIQGLLITPGQTIADSAGEVRTNAQTVDAETLRRIERQARAVAAAMSSSHASAADVVSSRATEQRAERLAAEAARNALRHAPEYPATNVIVDRATRIQMRTERLASATSGELHGSAPTPSIAADQTSAAPDASMHATAPAPSTIYPDRLSDAGPTLPFVAAALMAVLWRGAIARKRMAQ